MMVPQETPPVLEEVAPQDKSPLEVLAPKLSLLGMMLQQSRRSTLDQPKQPRPPVSSQGLGIFYIGRTHAWTPFMQSYTKPSNVYFRVMTIVYVTSLLQVLVPPSNSPLLIPE